MLIQDSAGNLRTTTVEDDALLLNDLKQGDIFTFYNDSEKRVHVKGPNGRILDFGASDANWNDSFIDAGTFRVIYYPEARLVLGTEQSKVGGTRGVRDQAKKVK